MDKIVARLKFFFLTMFFSYITLEVVFLTFSLLQPSSSDEVWGIYKKQGHESSGQSCDASSQPIASHVQVTSQVECLALCSRDARCVHANYNASTTACHLFDAVTECGDHEFNTKQTEKVILV